MPEIIKNDGSTVKTVAITEELMSPEEVKAHFKNIELMNKEQIGELVDRIKQRDLDPRPDLKGDHALWGKLLPLAGNYSKKLQLNLWSLRMYGTRLERQPQGALRLTPIVDSNAWESETAFRTLAEMLFKPQTALLKQLLARV